jgi:uncharacterized protein
MVAMRDIRQFAQAVAREFKPRRIILFGSYAYGRPNADSDVDLLVIMPRKGSAIDKSLEIRSRIPAGFPLDLLTRTDAEVARRVSMNDWFMRDIVEKGKTLYEVNHARVGRKGGRRLPDRVPRNARTERATRTECAARLGNPRRVRDGQ